MVEAGANEITEAEILDALDIAQAEIKKLCALQRELARRRSARRSSRSIAPWSLRSSRADPRLARRRRSTRPRRSRTSSSARTPRKAVEAGGRSTQYAGARADAEDYAGARRAARAQRASTSSRSRSSASGSPCTRSVPTGALPNEIRDITIEVGVTPRTHGSALFTRGQTQALSVGCARHAQGGDAPRHPRTRDQEVLLAPLQLPAVLGRGGRLHARVRSAATSATARSPSARSCR